jgi:uncharacterized protein YjgD (DUF1641 family)
MDAVAEGVQDFKQARPDGDGTELPSIADMSALAGQLSNAAPALTHVLDSKMVDPKTIDVLSMVSEAAAEGVANAKANRTEVTGVRGAVRAIRDPEVQRGLGLLIEISRSLGRRVS